MGGGGGGSSSTEEKNTTVTTNTTTTVGDVGLTGGQIVDALNSLEQGVILREQIAADTIKILVQEAGKGYQQLIGGAGSLVQTAAKAGETALAAKDAAPSEDKKYIYLTGAALAAVALIAMRK